MTAGEPAIPSEGWGVLHLYYAIEGPRRDEVAIDDVEALVAAFVAEDGYQVRAMSVLGQRADVGLLLVGPDFARLQALQRAIERSDLGDRLRPCRELSFVSLTEASEYIPGADPVRLAEMREARLHPYRLPAKRVLCFYPMLKRREAERNWYALPFEERRRLMGAHGKTGRTFAGRVSQMITAATGLSDWEWGVTLFADDPKAIKDVVYEMRYDEGSAVYAEFGPFVVGLVAPLRSALEEAGLAISGTVCSPDVNASND
jgi:chlorite dismutase